MPEDFVQIVAGLDEEQALARAKELIGEGSDPMGILDDCRTAMDIVGQRFESGEYFISELLLAGEILKDVSAEVKPLITQDSAGPKKGKVLVGTVKGDIHDIGKDIVVFMLDINGFEVKDIGVDVPVETFVNEIKEFQPDIVALSGFLTLSYDSMKTTVAAIEEAGLRDGLKVMVGGGTIDQKISDYAQADAFGKDAMAAVSMANDWVGGN